ncbi:MAG TPA: 3-isopropylmalate dehydratase small subunit [Chloroflexi bacterium]|nr:3-isopropylmalate dehydratase small subunit [Chloroflexota bacterium]HCU97756.1 3-isopropylmalate dehydratase small subunit [Chloroflexota bacterium]|tara:strand:- start:1131 stop:1712 length:582 start_codon:yes stop_codon:yes gene_type:complete
MTKFTNIRSKVIVIPNRNIDTDQIIPARFLKVTDKNGLGDALFSDWRYANDGTTNPDFVLNQKQNQGSQILLTGDNFGCGSSREHAPWALTAWGIRAVISTSFADIFRNNALKNALLPIEVSSDIHQSLFDLLDENNKSEISIDLASQTLTASNNINIEFPIDKFAKKCLLTGVDQLGYILSYQDLIKSYEAL